MAEGKDRNCRCTGRAVQKLEVAIQQLLHNGKQVNKLLDGDRRGRLAELRHSEKAALKQKLNVQSTRPESSVAAARRKDAEASRSKNSNTSFYMTEMVPNTLPTEMSSTKQSKQSKPSSASSALSTSSASSQNRTTHISSSTSIVEKQSPGHIQLVKTINQMIDAPQTEGFIRGTYTIDRDGQSQTLPARVSVKQLTDGWLDITYVLLSEENVVMLRVTCHLNGRQTRNVVVNDVLVKN